MNASAPLVLLWFRRDLRLSDHPALRFAVDLKPRGLVPVFCVDAEREDPWRMTGAAAWWHEQQRDGLADDVAKKGSRLLPVTGDPTESLPRLARQWGITHAVWQRRHDPFGGHQDERVRLALTAAGVDVHELPGGLLHDPEAVRTRTGGPYQVFTPFWKRLQEQLTAEPPLAMPAPRRLPSVPADVVSGSTTPWPRLSPHPWQEKLAAHWSAGEKAAQTRWQTFAAKALQAYETQRDFPAIDGTAQLSPYLAQGVVSPRQLWAWAEDLAAASQPGTAVQAAVIAWQRQLAWREFAYHLLWHFPQTPDAPLREEFARFPWAQDPAGLHAWQRGRTGYPLIDAGMRQLWETGWMHNRVRMVVASFLTKDLRIAWQQGARWYWDTLIDADLANNTLGWQWTAGCGADAAPYFRILNPTLQSRKFDPNGAYMRRWLPELAELSQRDIHEPQRKNASLFNAALSRYPQPIVDHAVARKYALDALGQMRAERSQ